MLGSRAGGGVPKYIQLAAIIRERILRQEFSPEQKIPTETALGAEYRLSRITVREAVATLVRENLLERRQGRGTFVVAQKLRRDIAKVYSFSSDMRHLGLEPSSRVLALRLDEADAGMALTMKLPADNRKVTTIRRVRLANGTPILLETTLIPEYLCPGLIKRDLENGSLYRILTEDYGLAPHHAEETYESIIMGRRDAELLACAVGRPQAAFAISRLTCLEDGVPIELTRSVGRGDQLRLSINMVADQADFQRRVGVSRA